MRNSIVNACSYIKLPKITCISIEKWSPRKYQVRARHTIVMGDRQAASLLDQGVETKAKVRAWFDNIDTILTDCDGVLWLYDKVIEGSPETLNHLKQIGKKIYYVTNTSNKSRCDITSTTKRLGFNAEKNEVITASYLVASYLKQERFSGTAYVIGGSGIAEELDSVGIKHVGIGPDVNGYDTMEELVRSIKLLPDVTAVVVGFDYDFSYTKIIRAASYLQRPDCIFLATSPDQRYPISEEGIVVPAAGSIVRSIEIAAGREPICLGKPNDFISKLLINDLGLKPERTLMIGDNSHTDILMGSRCGFHTLLVLSGTTQLPELEKWSASSKPEDHYLLPDFYVQKLGDILPCL